MCFVHVSGRTEGLSGWLPRFGSFGSFTTAAPALGAMACSGAGNTVDPVAALDCAPVAATTIAGFNQVGDAAMRCGAVLWCCGAVVR